MFYISALALALATLAMSWGVFLSVRIFSLPDITTDGSYTLSAAVTAILLSMGYPWFVAMPLAVLAGLLAGWATALIHTRLNVNPLLSGILVMTALYSVNLMVMGRSNIPLPDAENTLFGFSGLSATAGWAPQVGPLLSMILISSLLFVLLQRFLRTDYGLALRATGQSEAMLSSMGVSVNAMKFAGLGLANALTGLSGSLVCQYQQFADINMGIGIVITGLGSVMMGDALSRSFRWNSVSGQLLGVMLGCVLFRLIMAFTLASGADPNLMKLLNALVVLLFVALPQMKGRRTAA